MRTIRTFALFTLALSGLLALTPATQPANKPTIVTTQEWGSTPQPISDARKHTPAFITIHHAGTEWKKGKDPAQFVKTMQSWGQREEDWPDLPYHFMIAPDGRIFEGRPLVYEPESNTKYNLQGNIGVELMGNFEIQRPSPAQLESCARLVAWLSTDLNIATDKIRGHKDAAEKQTVCPGKDFYRYLESGEFRKWVETIQRGEDPQIDPGAALEGGPSTRIATD